MRRDHPIDSSIALRALRAPLVAMALTLAPMSSARAETVEIVIQHLEQQETGATPVVGDTVIFVNRSDIAHNLYLTYEDGAVETLNTQPPGTRKATVMSKAGQVIVRCWIHPIIHMEFDVAEKK